MSLREPIGSDHQLARLLQIGVVLQEVIEARSTKHLESSEAIGAELETLLETAVTQANQHRARLETLIADLDADSVDYEDIEPLVEAQYQADQNFDDILYDQLCNAETAYKFFDDLLGALETSDTDYGVDHEELVSVLETLREAEARGVETVTDLMEAQR
ncbi:MULTISPECIES: ferritin-like domain-containing protein [unclassified Halorhabdus]|uniref:ferritin-like domain-containing protein n=1 Tax=unclassified Halorhabdus TaxID=2621901 RepID=UPI0023DB0F5B|nr:MULTISPECIES: ferritin-like domain-containing protein [unclassified Halorhabdus]WEL17373.1 Ferritin superfamily protein [Halorhabdus sp. SVX81]WEL21249.1 Ferritin superfamily protein [Halorhabdus sp. BNX81]